MIQPVVAKNAFIVAYANVMTIDCIFNLILLKSVIDTHGHACYKELKYHSQGIKEQHFKLVN